MMTPTRRVSSWLCWVVGLTAGHAAGETLLHADFDHYGPAPVDQAYTAAQWASDFPTSPWQQGVTPGRARIASGLGGIDSPGLRVTYPAGGVGPPASGVNFLIFFENDRRVEEATASYHLTFVDGFDWQRGGKLPGLGGGGAAATGGTPANGTNGWSARVMWSPQGGLYQYLYHVTQPGIFGERLDWKDEQGNVIQLEHDRRYELKTQIVMNTPDAADGQLRSWLDGQLVLERTDLRFRTVDTLAIDNLYFSTFHGGNDPTWAPDRDSHIVFDDVRVRTPDALAPLPGDFDANGAVEQGDLDWVLNNWGSPIAPDSVPGTSGTVDQDELDAVLNHWGQRSGDVGVGSTKGVSLPEPASIWLLAGWSAWGRGPWRTAQNALWK